MGRTLHIQAENRSEVPTRSSCHLGLCRATIQISRRYHIHPQLSLLTKHV